MASNWKEKLAELKNAMGAKGDGPERKKSPPVNAGEATRHARGNQRERSSVKEHSGVVASKAQIADREMPPAPQGGKGGTFNIGIDVGTSTTKVCTRPPGMGVAVQVLSLAEEGETGTALCPSSVAICGEEIFFGYKAEEVGRRPGAQIFRQLKVCLACEVGIRPEAPASWCQCLRDRGTGSCSACFKIGPGSREALASDLLTLFLAWAMGRARLAVTRGFARGQIPPTTYSISAPIDQIDAGSDLNGEYARITFNAWRLSAAVRQGMSIGTALRWVARAQAVQMPATEDILVELCPEGGAGIAGFALAPEMEEGQYGLIDIGAWTTEISFFRFSDLGRRQTGVPLRAYYASRSHRVAANEIDERCRRHVLKLYSETGNDVDGISEVIRSQREQGVFGEESLAPPLPAARPVPRSSPLLYAQDLVAEEIYRAFMITLREAYEKEKVESVWRGKLRLLFAGGGSLDRVLRGCIDHHFVREAMDVPKPTDLEGLPDGDDYRRFLVAYGLAHGSVRWPSDLLPSQTLPLVRRTRAKPSFEDLGYGAH